MTRCLAIACAFFFIVACERKNSTEVREKIKLETEQSEAAAKALGEAIEKANNNRADGFLGLYAISRDPDTYTVEYQEGANDALTELLCTKTELWIKTFAKVDGFEFDFGVLPQNIEESKYDELVRKNLASTPWTRDEQRLVNDVNTKLPGVLSTK